VTLNERFDYNAYGLDPSQIHGHYDITTRNTLIGPQAGVDLMYQHARWRAGARTKTGAYVNTSGEQSQVVTFDSLIPNNPPNRDEAARSRQFSFIYEVNLMAAYQIRRNVAWRIGFDLLALNELALAPNQIRFPAQATPIVDNSGFLLLMGGETGFEVVW